MQSSPSSDPEPIELAQSMTRRRCWPRGGARWRSRRAAVEALAGPDRRRFAAACRLCLACKGRVVVTGMGKSGHIARKIAATLASTGTPAFFLHPAEAGHGDLGMITRTDVVLAISNSGETPELVMLLPHLKRLAVPLIVMAGKTDSTLGRAANGRDRRQRGRGGLPARISRRPPAPPPRSPWATRWRSHCWKPADSPSRTSRAPIRAAASGGSCCCTSRT